jgi:geranylgeranyl reductase family protein
MPSGLHNDTLTFDIIIVGAGPAGCACALSLKDSGLNIALIEKGRFPRDKVCGDALSPDVLNQLEKLNGNLREKFLTLHSDRIAHITGVSLTGTRQNTATIDLISPQHHHGWVVKRMDFDNFLFEQICDLPDVTIFQDTKVEGITDCEEFISLETNSCTFQCKLVIGADGANSVVARKLAGYEPDRNHHSAAVRAYFTNIAGMNGSEAIELHFYKRSLPGYFWIFPLPNGEANVGLGMLSSVVSRKHINLKKLFYDLIESEPGLKARFGSAKQLTELTGFGLPLGSRKRTLSGNRFMLVGDAAAMIDPITGEGIGNAIRCGRFAATQTVRCFESNDFTIKETRHYEQYLYSKVWNEMRFSRFLHILLRYPFMLNSLLNIIRRSRRMHRFLNQLISDAGFWANGFELKRYLENWRRSARVLEQEHQDK